MSSFQKSNSIGGYGERLVINYLEAAGISAEKNEDKETRHLWDLDIKLGNKTARIEVKLDFLSNKTQNMAIEIENPISGKLTGLNVTTADIWVVLIRDDTNWAIFFVRTERLREYVRTNPGIKIEGVGDGNSTILLYPLKEILPIFVRIDNAHKLKDGVLDYSEIKKIVKNLLKG